MISHIPDSDCLVRKPEEEIDIVENFIKRNRKNGIG